MRAVTIARRTVLGLLCGGILSTVLGAISIAWAEPRPELTIDPVENARPGRPYQVVLRAVNVGSDARSGSITASFSGSPLVEVSGRSVLPPGPESYARVFEPGESMYNFEQHRAIPVPGRIAELYASPWPQGEWHVLQIQIVANRPVDIQARVTLCCNGTEFASDPQAGDGVPDPQGAWSYPVPVPWQTLVPAGVEDSRGRASVDKAASTTNPLVARTVALMARSRLLALSRSTCGVFLDPIARSGWCSDANHGAAMPALVGHLTTSL